MAQAIDSVAPRPMDDASSVLIISGVRIGEGSVEPDVDRPYPDYRALCAALRASTLDPDAIGRERGPVATCVRRTFGVDWTVALMAFRKRKAYRAVIAAGEDVGLKLAFLAKFSGQKIPIILTCHNLSSTRSAFYLRVLGVGSAIARFQCMSRAQARILTHRYMIAGERTQLIYWHVDHEFFRPDPSVAPKNQICSAGMASRDYATLIEATRDMDVDVKIAADSPWFRQALNISRDGVRQGVEVRSYGNYVALRQLYAESLFVVIPLLDVDFSAGYTVILEAMAMGKAVIVSRIKQRDDFVVDGKSGFHVAPGDSAQLRKRIRYLLDNPDEASRMGAYARTLVESRYTLKHYVESMKEALRELPESHH